MANVSKFKVGDRVRVSTQRSVNWPYNGRDGEVESVVSYPEDQSLVRVTFCQKSDPYREEHYFYEYELVYWSGLDTVLGMVE